MRLIDADAYEHAVQGNPYVSDSVKTYVKCSIQSQPTIDAEPVRHGKWKWLSCTYDRVPREAEYECSECHHKTIVHGDYKPWEKYCPNCGARMDGDRDEPAKRL